MIERANRIVQSLAYSWRSRQKGKGPKDKHYSAEELAGAIELLPDDVVWHGDWRDLADAIRALSHHSS